MSPTLAARRARRVLYACILVGAAVLVMGVIFGLVTILNLTQAVRDTQLEGTPLGKKLSRQADIIADCTSSEGDCYKRNQERTASAVADINRVVILASACAVGLDRNLSVEQRQTEIQACVIDRLAKRG